MLPTFTDFNKSHNIINGQFLFIKCVLGYRLLDYIKRLQNIWFSEYHNNFSTVFQNKVVQRCQTQLSSLHCPPIFAQL